MALMGVAENDFELLSRCAIDAERRGAQDDAVALDRLARRVCAALTVSQSPAERLLVSGRDATARTWQEVPTLLGRMNIS